MKGLSSSSSQPLSPRERLATRIPQVFLRHRDYPFEGMSHPTPHVRLRCMPGTNVCGQHVHWGPLRRRGPVGQRTFSSNFAENRSAEFCGEPTWKGQHVFLTLGFCLEVIVEIVCLQLHRRFARCKRDVKYLGRYKNQQTHALQLSARFPDKPRPGCERSPYLYRISSLPNISQHKVFDRNVFLVVQIPPNTVGDWKPRVL